MKTFLLAVAGVLVSASVVWADCQTIEVNGTEMELCEKEPKHSWEPDYGDIDSNYIIEDEPRGVYPEKRYRNGDMGITNYTDGTSCISREIAGTGIIQTDCQ